MRSATYTIQKRADNCNDNKKDKRRESNRDEDVTNEFNYESFNVLSENGRGPSVYYSTNRDKSLLRTAPAIPLTEGISSYENKRIKLEQLLNQLSLELQEKRKCEYQENKAGCSSSIHTAETSLQKGTGKRVSLKEQYLDLLEELDRAHANEVLERANGIFPQCGNVADPHSSVLVTVGDAKRQSGLRQIETCNLTRLQIAAYSISVTLLLIGLIILGYEFNI